MVAWLACYAAPHVQAESQRVLLLHSFGRDFAPFAAVVESLRSELSRSHPQPVEFFEASLQLARFDGEPREEPLVTYLESAFGGDPPGLIVAFGAPALDFVSRNRTQVFPDVPVISTGAEKRRVESRLYEPWLAVVHTD